LCVREKKPFMVIDASLMSVEQAGSDIGRFIEENGIHILNVAEPRASGWAEGYGFAVAVVGGVIQTSVDE
jgi:hypothetical protein